MRDFLQIVLSGALIVLTIYNIASNKSASKDNVKNLKETFDSFKKEIFAPFSSVVTTRLNAKSEKIDDLKEEVHDLDTRLVKVETNCNTNHKGVKDAD